jgi:putative ABC transport system permease protein
VVKNAPIQPSFYPAAAAFKNKFNYPFTGNFASFTATSTAEVKYEGDETDPAISVLELMSFLYN